MRIDAIRLREVGRFSEAVEITGFGPGLNVLAAPNEAGKSTIFRALSVAFRFAHTSRAEAVRQLQPNTGGAPFIACAFALGGHQWSLAKQYLAGRSAELKRLDGLETLRGGDAEDRLEALLSDVEGLPAAMPHLWVGQGLSFHTPQLDADARASFSALVRDELESAAGTDALSKILRRVETDLYALVTQGRGQPRAGGRLQRAISASRDAQEAYRIAADKAARADDRRARLAAISAEEMSLTAPDVEARRASEVLSSRKAVEEGKAAIGKLEVAEAQVAQCQEAFRAAAGGLQSFEADCHAFAAGQAQHVELCGRIEEASAGIATLEDELASRDDALALRQAALADLQQARVASEQKARLVAARQRVGELNRRIEETRSCELERERLRTTFADVRVRVEDVEALRTAVSDVRVLERQIAAGAPRVEVQYDGNAERRFRRDGRALAEGEAIIVTADSRISADGVGTLRITPGADRDGELARQELAAARERVAQATSRIGVADLSAAEDRLKTASKLEHEGKELAARIAALAPDGIEALVAERDAIEADLSAVPDDLGDEERYDTQPTDWRTRFESAQSELATETAQRAELAASLASAREANARLAGDLENLERRLGELKERLPEDEDGRKRLLREKTEAREYAEQALNAAVRSRDAWRDAAPSQEKLSQLTARLEEAEQSSEAARRKIAELREARRELEGALKRDVEDGVSADAEVKREQAARLEQHVLEIERERDALKLLQAQLQSSLEGQRAAVVAPLARRLVALAAHVFPNVDLRLDEDFEVQALERAGRNEVFAQLSDGTREQIAVLTRLALAQCVAEAGEAVPVVLDDALAYSDDERLTLIFDALAKAAEHQQIIILTCHERSFAPLYDERGATRLAVKSGATADAL